MRFALGCLGWTPPAFWAATPVEVWAAYEGWAERHGIRPPGDALTADEIEALEAMKRRFPDETYHTG